ncbi:MAG: toxin-antitoxin system HicB family antitoxin [candidate division Zixibacteria bacterium]|nr:toxin-antitoxin system HicB family antitoxin [candidate division Zixibacteria bacterium]
MSTNISDRYLKIVEWSDEDNCYIGTSPGLFDGGVHGEDEAKVFSKLCVVVEDTITIMNDSGKPLPKPTANKQFSGKIALRIPPDLHKAVAIKAMQEGESINKHIQHKLEAAI